jgi:L-asparagine oxygenase
MWTRVVPAAARRELEGSFSRCGPLAGDAEPFLASVFSSVALLPTDLIRSLLQFRADPTAPGMLLIEGMPVDADLPPTPVAAGLSGPKQTYVSEASILMVALLLGEPIGYADEKNGVLVQNVYPVEAEKHAPSNESSDTDLGFHTELSFSRMQPDRPLHVTSPDFLLLLGLRTAPLEDAVTTLTDAGDFSALLSDEALTTLSRPLFQLRAPYSFTQPNGVDRTWSTPVPLFHGSGTTRAVAFDLACGVRGIVPEAQQALEELRRVVSRPEVQRHVRLRAGDLLVINNRKCAHARSRFHARFDGSDRWVQRVYVRRSLEGLESSGTSSFRILA